MREVLPKYGSSPCCWTAIDRGKWLWRTCLAESGTTLPTVAASGQDRLASYALWIRTDRRYCASRSCSQRFDPEGTLQAEYRCPWTAPTEARRTARQTRSSSG